MVRSLFKVFGSGEALGGDSGTMDHAGEIDDDKKPLAANTSMASEIMHSVNSMQASMHVSQLDAEP